MRRFVILFLLVLLPIEVLAGISYEQRLALEAQHEASEHPGHSAPAEHSAPVPEGGRPGHLPGGERDMHGPTHEPSVHVPTSEHHARALTGDATLLAVLAFSDDHSGAHAHVQPGSAASLAFDFGSSDFSLDLGEAFDVPCQSHRRCARHVATRPVHASFSDKSIVIAVPTRPAI